MPCERRHLRNHYLSIFRMMNSKYCFLPLALLILFLCFDPSLAHKKKHPPQNDSSAGSHNINFKGSFSMVFAFGDSYTDTGNGHLLGCLKSFVGALLSHSQFGSTAFKKPTNRLCDGRLVIDFLTETLGLPPLPPYKDTSLNFSYGVNFAISGSTSLSSNYFLNKRASHSLMWKESPESFQTQINWFKQFALELEHNGKGTSSYKSDMENVLFWIGEMGVDDYVRTFGSSVSANLITQLTVNHVCQLLKTLLDHGAKYIVVQGLPPTGCLPIDLSTSTASDRDKMGCAASANSVIQAHNELLQKKLTELRKQHSGCMIIYADYWSAYQTILTNPAKYGFQEPFKACCGCGHGPYNFKLRSLCGSPRTSACQDPSKYINWDGVHLTEAMHKHLADLFFNHGYCQPSFAELVMHKKRTCA